MPSKTRPHRSHGHDVCGRVHEQTGRRCTKKPGHSGTRHSNEKPGYEIWWDDPELANAVPSKEEA